MLISEFARRAELTPDTVRFYIKRGLLHPNTTIKGGSNPYQIFSHNDLSVARTIRIQQSLGYSLREISDIAERYAEGLRTPQGAASVLRQQLERLEDKRDHIDAMIVYLEAKVAWLEGGQKGPAPNFDDYA